MTALPRYSLGLGRRFAPDDRDLSFSASALLPRRLSSRTYRYWYANGWWGDQGSTSQCVAYSWMHWVEDGPVVQPSAPPPILDPAILYQEAQKVDEWPGEDYEGTSVRAGAKVLQARGFISSYYWARSLSEVIEVLLSTGPMTVGTNWYDGMFSPDADNYLQITGALAGGHAYKLDGVNKRYRHFRMKNSWSRSWGNNGYALISFDTFERLLGEDGEACIATEVKKLPRPGSTSRSSA